eukprot:CAMPEP_0179135900 /NCGR_PEP_ID=MMETSP0796-20121207/64728_1 /TAXON_ID=73915 /ORGANISM="Pyrodinium bahamense, Strain pbaha01" /LENGTH=218 /DNA_ID=CAMNT_0020834945 /DNA_START=26 /DNA_END=682 /DNA_ORIENTATION=-
MSNRWVGVLVLLAFSRGTIAGFVCGNFSVTTLDVYRYHTANDAFTLANRNAGDAMGDMHYVCTKYDSQTYKMGLISRWTVSANSSWGRYAICNALMNSNRCYGTSAHVGRENAVLRARRGQCTENTYLGSWYSFPEKSECKCGQPVGTDGCMWGGARRLRTATARCVLEERGLGKACEETRGHGPYYRAAAILRAALASTEPEAGGCPEVSPQSELHL